MPHATGRAAQRVLAAEARGWLDNYNILTLFTHLRTSHARYRAALPADFLAKNPPPMYITLYFIVTRLPDSLRAFKDHFLALDPTDLTVDLLEQHLFAAETSVVTVGATRGSPRTPFFEGCSPSPLTLSYASAAAADDLGAEDVGAASASGKHRISKGKGGKGGGGGSGGGGGGSSGGGGGSGGGGSDGSGGGSGGFGGSGGSSGSGGSGSGGSQGGARGASGGSVLFSYVICTGNRAGQTCGKPHTQHRCFPRLDDAWRAEFGDEAERPRWAELLRSGLAIFDLDHDAILAAMYTLSVSAQGDCYLCVLPDSGIAAAALGASESDLPGTASAEALHTFTLDSGASRCFFRDSTTLTPLPAPVPVRLSSPLGGPFLARSSTVLPCPAVPSGSLSRLHLSSFSTNLVSTAALQDAMVTTTTPGGQRVSICMCTWTDRHLATLTRRPGSSLYTLATEPPRVDASAQVSASGPVAPPCSCRLLSHQTLLRHHRLGHPSLPRLRGMHSRLLVSGLPRSLPPLPPSSAPPCLPCIEGRQRTAPHSSSFPPTTAPLQTLHMDVWGTSRISGQDHERYFLLVVDDYTRYTTVFPLRSKGEAPDVLIPWIRTVRLQLRERFRHDLPVLRRHSDRGGEFSSDLLRDFCRGEGILQMFTLPACPQQNGIAEHRIRLVMEVACTSMIHAAAPHFLWPFAVRYAAHQLNLWPRLSLPETSPTLRWTGRVGDASGVRVGGSRAFVRNTSADKLSARAIPCVSADTSLPPFYVLVYIDDLVVATADNEALALVKSELQKRHTCTDLGELRSYLGLQITRDRARHTITLTQSHMVHQVLQRFGFRYSSPQSTPLPTDHSLSAPPSDECVEPSGPYPELVGSLMYLMTCTRPDLAYPLSILARYVAPGRHRPEHWEAAKRVLCYLCSTSGMGLVLGGRGLVVLTGHADASWVDDLATQRSSQGYTFSLGSGSVSWRSTCMFSVLSSSCEAEIYAGAMAAQELR
ncbi:unnamed protein product [Closterium sp. NIES-54]